MSEQRRFWRDCARIGDKYQIRLTRPKLWKQENAESFLQNFNSRDLSRINQVIDGLTHQTNVLQPDVDNVTHEIENLFHSACKNTFGMCTTNESKEKKSNKPWFNADCRSARNLYHKIRRLYNRSKSEYYKIC